MEAVSYSITKATPKAAKPAAKAADKTAAASPSRGSLLAGLAESFGGITAAPYAPTSLVSATATDKCKAVTVRKGETVELPFGAPYTPTVTAAYQVADGKEAEPKTYLQMTLIGVGGEACTNMTVNGGRPGKPEFTITDPEGKVVQKGSFEYG